MLENKGGLFIIEAKLIIQHKNNAYCNFDWEEEIIGCIESISRESSLRSPNTIYNVKLVVPNNPSQNDEWEIKTQEKENNKNEGENMAVKIKKQPVEISVDELKKGVEFETVYIHIDEDKKNKIEDEYGLQYKLLPLMKYENAEFDFKENYVVVENGNVVKIPYILISKVEVIE